MKQKNTNDGVGPQFNNLNSNVANQTVTHNNYFGNTTQGVNIDDTRSINQNLKNTVDEVKQEEAASELSENQINQDVERAENSTNDRVRNSGPQFNNSPVGFYLQGATIHNLVAEGDQIINNNFG